MEILKVKNLKTYFHIKGKDLPAVDGVSFSLREKEILAIIGESGSGKSMLSLSILNSSSFLIIISLFNNIHFFVIILFPPLYL